MSLQQTLQDVEALKQKGQLLYSKEQVEKAIAQVAAHMNSSLADKTPVFLCVMNGALIFMGQLMTQLNFPLQINYVHATRYQGDIEARPTIDWIAKPAISLEGRTVVIVEDILDSGITMRLIQDYCRQQNASEILTATLVDKKRPREVDNLEHCDFTGLVTGNKFLYGYGLDYQDFLRNEPGIYAVET